MMFELQQLQQLIAIAESGTLSAAAERLHLSQPALSRSMQKLEEHFGAPLFSRTKNRMTLNETGVVAVQQARCVIEATESFDAAVRQKIKSLTLRIIGSCAPGPLWDLVPDISILASGMTIAYEILDDEALLEARLRDVTYPLVLLSHPMEGDDIVCKPYIEEQLFVSFPAGHQLASRKHLWAKDLDGLTMLLFTNLGIWSHFHNKMTKTHFILQTDRQAFSDLVTASVLPNFVTNLSRDHQNPQLHRVVVPLMDKEAKKTFYLCARKSNQQLFARIKPRI